MPPVVKRVKKARRDRDGLQSYTIRTFSPTQQANGTVAALVLLSILHRCYAFNIILYTGRFVEQHAHPHFGRKNG